MNCIELKDAISVGKDLLLALVGVGTLAIAWAGLSTWRRQLVGGAHFEAGRALAKATYKLRDALRAARNPFLGISEFPAGYPSNGTVPSKVEADGHAHVFNARFQPVASASSEFDAAALEAEVLLGRDVKVAADKVSTCVIRLRVAMGEVIDDKASGGRTFGQDKDFAEEMRGIVFAAWDAQDPFSRQVQDSIAALESLIRPHLHRKMGPVTGEERPGQAGGSRSKP